MYNLIEVAMDELTTGRSIRWTAQHAPKYQSELRTRSLVPVGSDSNSAICFILALFSLTRLASALVNFSSFASARQIYLLGNNNSATLRTH